MVEKEESLGIVQQAKKLTVTVYAQSRIRTRKCDP